MAGFICSLIPAYVRVNACGGKYKVCLTIERIPTNRKATEANQ